MILALPAVALFSKVKVEATLNVGAKAELLTIPWPVRVASKSLNVYADAPLLNCMALRRVPPKIVVVVETLKLATLFVGTDPVDQFEPVLKLLLPGLASQAASAARAVPAWPAAAANSAAARAIRKQVSPTVSITTFAEQRMKAQADGARRLGRARF